MKRNGGFTLLEILVALVILGIGVIAVMQLCPASVRQSRVAAERTVATNVANAQLAKLRGLDLGSQFRDWLTENTQHTVTEIESIYALYQGWSTTVQRVVDSQDTYRVTFTVQMADGRYETFVTYVTPR